MTFKKRKLIPLDENLSVDTSEETRRDESPPLLVDGMRPEEVHAGAPACDEPVREGETRHKDSHSGAAGRIMTATHYTTANVSVQEVHGAANQVYNIHGGVHVKNLKGVLLMNETHATVNIKRITESSNVQHVYGGVRLSDIQGGVEIQRMHGDVFIQGVSGNVVIQHLHGNLNVNEIEAGGLTIEHFHSSAAGLVAEQQDFYLHALKQRASMYFDLCLGIFYFC